ncbi:MAG: DUF456 domain-containing protein [Panacagrimonas sp.]
MDFNELLVIGLALIMVAIGVAGAVLPALPGLPMVFGGLWALSWVGDYERVGVFTLTLLAVLLVIGMALDFIAGSIGAKRFGASPQAVAGSLVGAFVGVFFGLPGLILGPFIGAVAGEIKARRPLEQAAFSGLGAWIGLLLGVVAKLVITVVMLAVFAFDYFV